MLIPNHRLDLALRHALLTACTMLITYLSLMPIAKVESDIPPSIQAYDLPFHVFVYFVLTSLMIWAVARHETQKRDRINLFLFCSLFGATLEILQAVLPSVNRSCTVSDFFSNTAGAALAALIFPIRTLLSRAKK